MTNRRSFMLQVSVGSSALFAGCAMAQAQLVDEKNPQAIALGYKADTTKVDKVKYANHVPAQQCSNCALFQGKVGDAAGACPLFAGKVVAAKGWCSAYSKKA